ncbi:uncharacterized protein Z519_07038 [Cladophialophora bantiana CBS 173.52]|uniref:Uncharacterized protein n=1 Tax=Cladophialophora bantiana (strain ATCC 10958 / CBS 173.52 / CDC B-1940 / NIH 8579) TaxID=1442370 RepID=A0A0D2HMR5_CLAB1|nr:uncharacterized protein Z519_07038 [Cladophialophora bantiana CBS 173.52]KIW92055.1 hypothetical protein Z519_07038 [Cladophialophora bantiana CBS 173.52]
MTDHPANTGGCDPEDPPQAVVTIDDDHSEWSRVCLRHPSVETSSLDGDVLPAVCDTNSHDKSDGGSEESYDNEPPTYADSAEQDLLRQCFPAGTATPPDASSLASLSFRTQLCEDIRVNEAERSGEPEQPTGLQAQTEPRLARDDERNLKRKASTELECRPSKSTEEWQSNMTFKIIFAWRNHDQRED